MLNKFVVACFGLTSFISASELQNRALVVKRGFMVALHFLKQRNDTPIWVRNANNGEIGNKKIDYNSSFEEIGSMLREIADCKASNKQPVLFYDQNTIKSQANWNYVFIKRCIYNYLISGNYNYDEVKSTLNKKYIACYKQILKANSDSHGYLEALKLASVLSKIKNTLDSGITNVKNFPGPLHMKNFHGFAPYEIFPSLRLRQQLPTCITTQWWVPAPPAFGQHRPHGPHGPHRGHHGSRGPMRHDPTVYWYFSWLPQHIQNIIRSAK